MILVVPTAALLIGIYLVIARTRFLQVILGIQVIFLSLAMISGLMGVIREDFVSTHLLTMIILLMGLVVVIAILALGVRMFYLKGDATLEQLERLKR